MPLKLTLYQKYVSEILSRLIINRENKKIEFLFLVNLIVIFKKTIQAYVENN